MKALKFSICLLLTIIVICNSFPISAQKPNGDYYAGLKDHDLSKLWHSDSLKMEGSNQTSTFPEPLGFIGNDYHRFYIHYTSVTKERAHPYQYNVSGKARIDSMIWPFKGTITLTQAYLLNGAFAARYKQGELLAHVYLKEDNKQKQSGYIQGELKTAWHIDKNGKIVYDTINCVSDNFSNNQFTGIWTGYTTRQSKKCNWGDFRIPQSGDLDRGEGEFDINPKYIHNGWRSFYIDKSDKPEDWWR